MGNLSTIFGDNETVLTLRLREHQHHGNCHQQKPWYCRDVVCPPAENTQSIQSLKMETGQILLRLHVMLTENKSAVCGLPQHFPLAAAPAVRGCGIDIPECPRGEVEWILPVDIHSTRVGDNCSLWVLSKSIFILQRPIKKMVEKEKTTWCC